MVTIATFRQMALAMPGAEELPHFDIASFRVKNKIFATIHDKHNRVMVKLSPIDQSVFCAIDAAIIYPVSGGWGKGGATFVELSKVKKALLQDALTHAWLGIAPKKLVEEWEEKKG